MADVSETQDAESVASIFAVAFEQLIKSWGQSPYPLPPAERMLTDISMELREHFTNHQTKLEAKILKIDSLIFFVIFIIHAMHHQRQPIG